MAGQPEGFRLGLADLRRNGLAAWMKSRAPVLGDNVRLPAAKVVLPGGGAVDDVVAVLSAMAWPAPGVER